MNGLLLGVILIAIFLTGIFTGTSADTSTEISQSEMQTIEAGTTDTSFSANTTIEVYRVAGKTFDPHLLSVECYGTGMSPFSHMLYGSRSTMREVGKTQTLSLRSDNPIQIHSSDSEKELSIEEIQIGDMLLVVRDAGSNGIVRVTVETTTIESKNLI